MCYSEGSLVFEVTPVLADFVFHRVCVCLGGVECEGEVCVCVGVCLKFAIATYVENKLK